MLQHYLHTVGYGFTMDRSEVAANLKHQKKTLEPPASSPALSWDTAPKVLVHRTGLAVIGPVI